jgi:hypothetical protein
METGWTTGWKILDSSAPIVIVKHRRVAVGKINKVR